MTCRPPLLVALLLCLAACAQTPAPAAAADPPQAATPPAPAPAPPSPSTAETPMPAPNPPATPPATQGMASIEGDIREGNRPPPALRVCAQPLGGGAATCVETAAGASRYRIELEAGRYTVSAQARDDAALTFAHAERIRCIRAPCPPDTALVVEVGAGEAKTGIDLSAGAAQPPAG